MSMEVKADAIEFSINVKEKCITVWDVTLKSQEDYQKFLDAMLETGSVFGWQYKCDD